EWRRPPRQAGAFALQQQFPRPFHPDRIFSANDTVFSPHPQSRNALFLRPQPNLLPLAKASAETNKLARQLCLPACSFETRRAAEDLAVEIPRMAAKFQCVCGCVSFERPSRDRTESQQESRSAAAHRRA